MRRFKTILLILVTALVGLGAGIGIAYLQAPKTAYSVPEEPKKPVLSEAELAAKKAADEAEKQRVALTVENLAKFTNEERTKLGLSPVALNAKLNASAQAKCNDMVAINYWAHNRPDGTPPWQFITNAGYSYSKAAENLAFGFENSETVLEGWMNSPKHRENIEKPYFTEIGFGICISGNYENRGKQTIVVQHFARPYGI